MDEFTVGMQGYDREIGMSFALQMTVCAANAVAAKRVALEEAVRQGFPVAVVYAVTRTQQAISDETTEHVTEVASCRYLE